MSAGGEDGSAAPVVLGGLLTPGEHAVFVNPRPRARLSQSLRSDTPSVCRPLHLLFPSFLRLLPLALVPNPGSCPRNAPGTLRSRVLLAAGEGQGRVDHLDKVTHKAAVS